MLIHDMEELRALKGWRIEIVFDGYGRDVNGLLGSGSGSATANSGNDNDNNGASDSRQKIAKIDQEATKKVTDNGVRVVFSGVGMSADGYIEARCYDAKKVTDGKLTGSLIIATDDNLIRSAGASAGAVSMSANRLIDELRALRKSTMYRVEAAVAKANGHAMRPEKLMGTILPSKLTRGAIIIEDKRNRPKKRKKKEDGEQVRTLDDLKKGTTSLPSWAVVPPKDSKI
jgi:predicted RNA-binding protein with PIN domain